MTGSAAVPGPGRDDAVIACSHVTLASADVQRMMRFLEAAFALTPRYENDAFGEFVLKSGFRIAVFAVTGSTRAWFRADGERGTLALGVTARDPDAIHARLAAREKELGIRLSGPPKDHPWGERSFLLVDPDGNRWEIARAPGADGMLVDL